MRFIVTFTGRTLEFLDLEERALHLRPKQTLELSQKELDEVKDKYQDVFGQMFVHDFTPNQLASMKKDKKDKPVVVVEKVEVKSEKKPVGRPKSSEKKSDSDQS